MMGIINNSGFSSNSDEILKPEFFSLVKSGILQEITKENLKDFQNPFDGSYDLTEIRKANLISTDSQNRVYREEVLYKINLENVLEKSQYGGRNAVEGEVREWGGKSYKKTSGKWGVMKVVEGDKSETHKLADHFLNKIKEADKLPESEKAKAIKDIHEEIRSKNNKELIKLLIEKL